MRLKHLLLFVLLFSVTHAQAQTLSRLIAVSHNNWTGTAFGTLDTSNYMYLSTVRGSNMKTHIIKYDTAATWNFVPGNATPTWTWKNYQTFDANNNILTNQSNYWDTIGGGMWVNATFANNTYDANNMLTLQTNKVWRSGAWRDTTQTMNTYASNNLVMSTQQIWDPMGLTLMFTTKDSFAYDASNNMTVAIHEIWSTSANNWMYVRKTNYNYTTLLTLSVDSIWNTTSNSWKAQYRTFYYYNAANKIYADLVQKWTGAAYATNNTDSFYYDASNNQISKLTMVMDTVNHILVNSTNVLSTYDANHNVLSQTNTVWASTNFLNTTLKNYTYDTLNNMLTYITETWYQPTTGSGLWMYVGGANPDVNNRYYYSTYGSSGVAQLSNATCHLNVYPNPAANFVNIDMQWQNPQAFSVAIYDIQGRLMQSWSEAATAHYEKLIPISHIPAGNYFIKITNSNNEQITKQLVVTH